MAGWQAAKQIPLLDVLRKSESPAGFMTIAGLGLVAVVALNVSNRTSYDHATYSAEPEPASIANVEAAEPAPAMPPPTEAPLEDFKLRRNETLIGLLQRAKISRGNAHAAVNALDGLTDLRKLQRGQLIQLKRDQIGGNQVQLLHLRDNFADQATIERRGVPRSPRGAAGGGGRVWSRTGCEEEAAVVAAAVAALATSSSSWRGV